MLAQASIPASKFNGAGVSSRRTYPATTEYMPILNFQLLAKTFNVIYEIPSGVELSGSTPANIINQYTIFALAK